MVGCSRKALRSMALALVAAGAAAMASARPVEGLIVKLKDAPGHERAARLEATRERLAHADRLQRVLQMSRLTDAQARAVGRDAEVLRFGRPLSPDEAEAMAERLRALPEVEWVETDRRERLLQAAPTPNDPYFPYRSASDLGQWWLRAPGETLGGQDPSHGVPGVQDAWALQAGRPSAVVAVLDTGITPHPDLVGRVLPGYDFVSGVEFANDGNGRDADPSDPGDWVSEAEVTAPGSPYSACSVAPSSWHGTIIAGIVAAATQNGAGVAGISWNGRVLPVRVAGKCGASVTDITDGMRWAAGLPVAGAPPNANPARIINISFGGDAACSRLYQDTIDELAGRGVVVVAAAGNGMGGVSRPANCQGVISVAALARDGLKAWYSNFGPQVTLATVGGDDSADGGLLTLLNTGTQSPGSPGYGHVAGTSFAAPVVSGVVSLMLSQNERLSVAQVIAGLRATVRPHVRSSSGVPVCSASNASVCVCTTSTCGAGVLDAPGAVRHAASPPPAAGGGNDDGGGGALGGVWLAGLALAVWQLARLQAREAGALRRVARRR